MQDIPAGEKQRTDYVCEELKPTSKGSRDVRREFLL